MKVLFTIAPYSWQELYPDFQSRKFGPKSANRYGLVPGPTAPLGIMYLSSILKKEGYDVDFIDGVMYSFRDWYDKVLAAAARVIGFHCSTFAWERVKKISERIKKEIPGAFIIVGGPHPTHSGKKILKEGKAIDVSFRGDSEIAIAELCRALESGSSDFSGINNIIWRRGEDIVENDYLPLKDMDSIPFPDLNLIDLNRYSPSIGFYKELPSTNVVTSRGCQSDCKFCVASRTYNARNIDNVIAELEMAISDFGVKHVIFYDEDLLDNKDRAAMLCEKIMEKKLRFSWCCNARADSIEKCRELLPLMKKTGCWRLLVGIESGSPRILDLIQKDESLDQIARSLTMTRKAGIETFGTIMFGYPTETFEDGLKTIDFCCSSDLSYLSILNFAPFPGSEYNADREDILSYGTPTGLWGLKLISFVPNSMTEDDMIKLNLLAYRKFYMRPSYLLKRFLDMRKLEDLKRNMRGFFAYKNANYHDMTPSVCLKTIHDFEKEL